MGFIYHVEHPHKFISNYLATLGAPLELRQGSWNLANDSLRTTLCVRFKSEVVACGVVYAAARRFQVPLPENPPWWLVFDADQAGIEEVCRVLAHLYSLPKAQYLSVYKDVDSFTSANQTHISKESPVNGTANDSGTPKSTNSQDSKDVTIKAALDKLKESKKSDEDLNTRPADVDTKDDGMEKPRGDHKLDANGKNHERERERSKIRERSRDLRGRDSDHDNSRGRDSDRDRDWEKERSHRSKDKISEKPRHHSSRDRSEYHSSHSSRDKERHRHHTYS